MDVVLIIKSFFTGIIWTGSFYLMAAFVLPIFPFPLLLSFQDKIYSWSENIYWLDQKKSLRRWKRSRTIMKVISALIWLGLMTLCFWLLKIVLETYLLKGISEFWTYYSIAFVVPFVFLCWMGIRLFRKKTFQLPIFFESNQEELLSK